MEEYDCTEDVRKHQAYVRHFMRGVVLALLDRSLSHDESKLKPPEKECFDKWTPELKQRTFGTNYYKQALDEMGEGIKHHYDVNRHHPEHFTNGVNDMTFIDVIEMFCDWCAAAELKRVTMDADHARERFGLSEQLFHIIVNTLIENDANGETKDCLLTPVKYR